MEYSERVLARMKEKGVSAYRVARETGLSESLFSKWKARPTSDISILTLEKTAGCLGVTVAELLREAAPRENGGLPEEEYRALWDYACDCLTPPVHGRDHIARVLEMARRLAEGGDVRLDLLTAACVLHDIGRPEEARDSALDHALVGAGKARRFLTARGWHAGDAAHVADCIATHSRSTGNAPQTMEAKLLYDADKLDLTGAIGTARAILHGAVLGEPLYRLTPSGAVADDPADPPSLLRFYRVALQPLYEGFFTERAAEIAGERRAEMTGFFEALRREATGRGVSAARLRE